MAVIAGYEASLYLMDTDQTPAALTLEPLEAVDTGRTVWRVAARAKRWLNPAVAVAVKVDGVITAPQAIIHAGGFVRFASGVAAGAAVTIDGEYFTAVNKLAGAKQWSLDIQADELDVTSWDSGTWREFMTVIKGATASFDKWWFDQFFLVYIQDTTAVGLELRTKDDKRYYCYGNITSDSIKAASEGAIEESINVRVTGPVEYTEE
jgi:hypothetical protein